MADEIQPVRQKSPRRVAGRSCVRRPAQQIGDVGNKTCCLRDRRFGRLSRNDGVRSKFVVTDGLQVVGAGKERPQRDIEDRFKGNKTGECQVSPFVGFGDATGSLKDQPAYALFSADSLG